MTLAGFEQDMADVESVIELATLMARVEYVGHVGRLPREVKLSHIHYGSPLEVGILIAGWSWVLVKGLQAIATVVDTFSNSSARRAEGRAADAEAERNTAEAEKLRAEAEEIRFRTRSAAEAQRTELERHLRARLHFDEFLTVASSSLSDPDRGAFEFAMKTPREDGANSSHPNEADTQERRQMLERLAAKGFVLDTSNLRPST
ncbi:hypothetical protein ARHIZOSPH14_17660 [Agromyces rhizosphaerae]|uniref:Uncharacterized protein n=1 Tax=Agromyces rhizosphaerae TaxID=88374 RepID=A0A9W6FP08_9MICO|nr:hypothetical protein ARHIZOSPH14_17660 [Agromyces rhizosphaerae]